MIKSAFAGIAMLIFGLAVLCQFVLLDGLAGLVLPLIFATDTSYTNGYSTRAFREVRQGMSDVEVTQLLGQPYAESWQYSTVARGCGLVWLERGVVQATADEPSCSLPGVPRGSSRDLLIKLRGTAPSQTWLYSWSPTDKSFRERIIKITNNRVASKTARFYLD